MKEKRSKNDRGRGLGYRRRDGRKERLPRIEPLNLNQEKFEKFPAKSISIFSHNLKSIMYFGSGEFSNYTGKCVDGVKWHLSP